MSVPRRTVNAPLAEPWSCHPVPVPAGQEISHSSKSSLESRRSHWRVGQGQVESVGKVVVEGVVAEDLQ